MRPGAQASELVELSPLLSPPLCAHPTAVGTWSCRAGAGSSSPGLGPFPLDQAPLCGQPGGEGLRARGSGVKGSPHSARQHPHLSMFCSQPSGDALRDSLPCLASLLCSPAVLVTVTVVLLLDLVIPGAQQEQWGRVQHGQRAGWVPSPPVGAWCENQLV